MSRINATAIANLAHDYPFSRNQESFPNSFQVCLLVLLGASLYYKCYVEKHKNHPENARHENEKQAMTKLRLLIKRPGRTNTCIPVTVNTTDNIGNCISSLVNHLDIPRRDSLGRTLTYSLRPLSAKQPLAHTMRFAEAHLQSETRLVLELDKPQTVTPSVHPSVSTKSLASTLVAEPLRKPSIVTRRTFVIGGVLTGCAVSGLFTGIATAFATTRRALPIPTTMTMRPMYGSGRHKSKSQILYCNTKNLLILSLFPQISDIF